MIPNLYLQRKCVGSEKCDRSCLALQSVVIPGATIDLSNQINRIKYKKQHARQGKSFREDFNTLAQICGTKRKKREF